MQRSSVKQKDEVRRKKMKGVGGRGGVVREVKPARQLANCRKLCNEDKCLSLSNGWKRRACVCSGAWLAAKSC